MRLLIFFALTSIASTASACGFGPWHFGMTAAEIRAVSSQGPYRTFKNGDLETYNATLCDQKQNVQFYLRGGHLLRIVVVTYEGTGLNEATNNWLSTYNCLAKLHGALETPGLRGENARALANQAEALVSNGTKVQMAPLSQSKDRFIFSSFDSYTVKGVTIYRVWINYDKPSP
jgi:hypothetical protein